MMETAKKKVLIIGDIMLDIYFEGNVHRISPEAPVPVFLKKREYCVPGGAANVAINMHCAGLDVYLMGMVGNDQSGDKLISSLENIGVHTELIARVNRRTTTKTRFLADNNQQVLRLDVEDTEDLPDKNAESMYYEIAESIQKFDILVISDYMKGLLTYDFTHRIIEKAKCVGKCILVDVKDSDYRKYKGASLIKPNLNELSLLTQMEVGNDEDRICAGQSLRLKCEADYVLITCGADGMLLISQDEPIKLPAVKRDVYDVTGAGDTALAYLTAEIVKGMSVEEAMIIANYASAVQVGKVGTSPVYWNEVVALEKSFDNKGENTSKLLDKSRVGIFRAEHKAEKIVFTNGCFDILHSGHTEYLREAASLGDILVVGLNSDASIKRIKGDKRPINGELERAEILSALSSVDYVVIFEEDTPNELIRKIMPDVLVKGEDYKGKEVVGSDFVKSYGGEVKLLHFKEGQSTTSLIDKIRSM